MNPERMEAALTRAVEAWNSGDVGSYLDLYDEKIKLHLGTYELPDKESVASMYRGFFAATSGPRLDIHETFGQDDKLAARYTVTGTITRELMGIPPAGQRITITGITVMHFDDDRVIERWDADDSVEVFSKLREDSP